MPVSKTEKVETLADFVSIVESIYSEWDCLTLTTHPWFRGQTSAVWSLIPGLYRGHISSYYERELIRDFSLRAKAYLEHAPTNDLEWLFVMQHYGMPTRLLDWTESHLFALYFAICTQTGSGDAAVWILDPWSINDRAIGMQSVPTADHPSLTGYALNPGPHRLGRKIQATIPVAVRPPRISSRIIAQKGTFTIHGSSSDGLDVIAERLNRADNGAKIRLHKVIIDGSRKKQLRKQLYLAGISEAVLFPDLSGLCGEIGYRYSVEYMKEMTELGQIRLTAAAPGSGSSKPSGKKSSGKKRSGGAKPSKPRRKVAPKTSRKNAKRKKKVEE